jgi:hypothetical protein
MKNFKTAKITHNRTIVSYKCDLCGKQGGLGMHKCCLCLRDACLEHAVYNTDYSLNGEEIYHEGEIHPHGYYCIQCWKTGESFRNLIQKTKDRCKKDIDELEAEWKEKALQASRR